MTFGSYFTHGQFALLAISLCLIVVSAIHFESSKKINVSLSILLCSVFLLKLFVILLDPFLHTWDEQVHALVAKNLSQNFLRPLLYPKDLLPYEYRAWWANYIWVHKQPFFLWQMALAIKLFGTSVFAIRLPSAICLTFAAYCIYKIGANFTTRRIGFYGAIFFSLNNYINELATGLYATDHNDIIAITYITASIWALSEHMNDPDNKKWRIHIGLFSGLAVLTKWALGLLVYSGWLFYIIASKPKDFYKFSRYVHLLKSLSITILIALPWQLYILNTFPTEANHELIFNSKHFTEAIEGHSGNNWYYFDHLSINYGYISPLFVLLGLILLYRYTRSTPLYFTVLFYLVVIYSFFTISVTKMPSFAIIGCSFVFLGFGAITETFWLFLNNYKFKLKPVLFFITFISSAYITLDIESIQEKHSLWKKNLYFYYNRKESIEWKVISEKLDHYVPNKNYVIFNCRPEQCVKLMFYSDYIAYAGIPDQDMIGILKSKNYNIAVMDNGTLPEAIYNDKQFLIIQPPAFKAVSIDTVFIKTKSHHFLSVESDGKLVCNDATKKNTFILKTFENGCTQIRLLNGPIAKATFELGGLIIFNKNEYTFTERFVVEQNGSSFKKIKTEDGYYLKVVNDGERLVAIKGNYYEDCEFEFLPIDKINERK